MEKKEEAVQVSKDAFFELLVPFFRRPQFCIGSQPSLYLLGMSMCEAWIRLCNVLYDTAHNLSVSPKSAWTILRKNHMFKRNAKNNSAEISDAQANIIASRKLRFWLKRFACVLVKTNAMYIINRTSEQIGIQHEKKHGKSSKNSSIYFDNKMIEEVETEKLLDIG